MWSDAPPVAVFLAFAVCLIVAQSLLIPVLRRSTNANGLHLARRAQHAASGLVLLPVSYSPALIVDHRSVCLALLLVGAAIVFALHLARLRSPAVQRFLVAAYGPLARQDEIDMRVPGAFWFMLGLAFALALAGPLPEGLPPLRMAALNLALGDPMAGIVSLSLQRRAVLTQGQVGRLFDRSAVRVYGKKTLAGSAACLLTCAACALTQTDNVAMAAWAGAVGALAEASNPAWMDDNFWIPVTSVLALRASADALGGF